MAGAKPDPNHPSWYNVGGDNPDVAGATSNSQLGSISFNVPGLFVNPTDDPNGIATDDDFQLNNYYYNPQKIYAAGITSPGGFQGSTVAFFRTSNPVLIWMADWTSARTNQIPLVPDPYNPADKNWVLLDVKLEPMTAKVNPNDGSSVAYRINGTYIFGHKNPNAKVFAHARFGRQPWIKDSFPRTITLDKLQKTLMDTTQNIATGFTAIQPNQATGFTAGS